MSHPGEPHEEHAGDRLNWLRAGVLGANDGIVSVAGIVIGVAGATSEPTTILTAGIAGLVAGAVSMALGEYVSVSSQRDTEKAMLELERRELIEDPDAELRELAELYEAKGLKPETAHQVAVELTEQDAFTAHAEAELGIDPTALTRPLQATVASAISFTVGALLPLVAVVLSPAAWKVPITIAAVLLALAITGLVSAKLGRASSKAAIIRLVVGGGLGLGVTYGIGHLIGAAV